MIPNIWTMARKEMIHIRRDPRSIVLLFLLPLIMMMLYGYAINMDLKDVRVGVLDQDHGWAARAVTRNLQGSDFFLLYRYFPSRDAVRDAIQRSEVRAAVNFPADFTRLIGRGQSPDLQILIDGSDANTGKIVEAGLLQVVTSTQLGPESPRMLFQLQPRVWYNPEMKGVNFIVPGLIAVFLMMIATILTSITIAREKETGTMIQLRLSPAKPLHIILGKVLPYTLLAFLVGGMMLVFALLYYRVPFQGSPLLLAGFGIAYLLAALSIGLLASTFAKTQQVAMAAGLLGTMLPSIILSGFIFPLRSMPRVLIFAAILIFISTLRFRRQFRV
ncbi:MAG: ABC transporter permease [Calditrichota bacterium]